jgi:Tfp pilus assembly ATPase PilU
MLNTTSVTKLIHADQLDKLAGVIELGGADGMQTFEMALYELVKAGRITSAEALLHAPIPEALKMRFQGVVLSEHRRILGSRE